MDWLVARRVFTVYAPPDGEGWAALLDLLRRTPAAIPVIGYLSSTGAVARSRR